MVPKLLNNGTSSTNSLTTSSTAAGGANATVPIPLRIHSVSLSYLTHMDYLFQCHDIWDKADHLAEKFKGLLIFIAYVQYFSLV